MHRRPLLELLARYAACYPEEGGCLARVRALVESRPDCFDRTCLPGHVTASAWVLSADRRRFLLAHHRKLDRWLQLGGHADGESDVARVALREAREESGLRDLAFLAPEGAARAPFPIDLDVHAIPAGEARSERKRSAQRAEGERRAVGRLLAGRQAAGLASEDPSGREAPGEPAHEHHDVRFVLVARDDREARASDESHALHWFEMEDLESCLRALGADASLLRLGRKARALLALRAAARGVRS